MNITRKRVRDLLMAITRKRVDDLLMAITRNRVHDIREMMTVEEISEMIIEELLRTTIVHNQVSSMHREIGYKTALTIIGTGIPDLDEKATHGRNLVRSMSESRYLSSIVVADGKTRAAE